MQTPNRVTPEQFNEQLAGWLDRYAVKIPDGKVPEGYQCIRCGTLLGNVRAIVAIHKLGGSCDHSSGTRAKVMNIPYCPTCEHAPEYMGCVHVPDPAAELLTTLGGARG